MSIRSTDSGTGIGHVMRRTLSPAWKSLLAVFISITLCLGTAAPEAYAEVRKADIILGWSVDSRGLSVAQCPSIDAQYALVVGADGTVFFERDAYTAAQIASITKVMTGIVAIENAPLDTTITVSSRAASVGESSASLQAGDTMSLELALQAMLLSSGNDAAVAISECIGRLIAQQSGNDPSGISDSDAEQIFIDKMNSRAAELGCMDTFFENAHGLDDEGYEGEQHSTAYDLGILSRVAMAMPAFRNTVAMLDATITVNRADGTLAEIALSSTDDMLRNGFEGACGIKTGYTALAGQCFAGAATRNGIELYAIVLNSSSQSQRFTDAETLLDWAFSHLVEYPVVHSQKTASMTVGGQSATVPIVAEVAHTDWIDKTVKATVADPNQTISVFDLNGNISQKVEFEELSGNIEAGDKVGTLTLKQRNNDIVSVDLIACESVAAPDLFEGIGIWWDRLFRGFTGGSKVAESTIVNETPLIVDKTGSL